MLNNDQLQQEIFDVYTTFPDKDKSFEFAQGMIYSMGKYNIIDANQVKNAYWYNKNLHINFE